MLRYVTDLSPFNVHCLCRYTFHALKRALLQNAPPVARRMYLAPWCCETEMLHYRNGLGLAEEK